jgi:LacI family transcriptional regulator
VARGPGRKAATLADVASATGLSQAAVSLALRGKPGVSDETRAKALEAARRLGYRPAPGVARTHGNPLTVTLVIRALHGDSPDANRFYGPVLAGIEERCRRLHIRLMFAIMPVDEHNRPVEIPHTVTDHQTDGLILVGAHFGHQNLDLLRGTPPAVLVDAYAEEEGVYDSIDTDNVYGGRTATRHLVEHGHRHIAILGTAPDAFPSIRDRRLGYEQALAEAGLVPHFIDVPYYEHEKAAAAGVEYLRGNPEITAVFCANDLVAVTLIQAARPAGIDVPGRISVVGFDDIDLASFISPALTTMAVDKPGMGRLAVSLLWHQIEVEKRCVTATLVRPELIQRETVRTLAPSEADAFAAASMR